MNKTFFETSDLPLAAFLNTLHFEIVDLKYFSPRSIFCFARSVDLDAAIERYFQNKARVDPLLFSFTTKKLKSMIALKKTR